MVLDLKQIQLGNMKRHLSGKRLYATNRTLASSTKPEWWATHSGRGEAPLFTITSGTTDVLWLIWYLTKTQG